ncbi:MAG: farnesyl-diphosphate synthase [Desulfobacteraceae bacterium IS3]|nr:MAG: farnesyl-diphosphate synthase [Desulfobacteraceae bacterium IS3]HAO23493.1 farnesyl-diphosphate synthase [Desulfobacteraceae bacterium]
MPDLKAYLNDKNSRINAGLQNFIKENTRIAEAMRYSLMAGGKRIRPVLCIAAAETVGGSEADVMPIACAIEMIHTYSLIHDDLPAMDNDDLRRGKPTCHVAFNEAAAILAGDALLTLAFEILAKHHSGQIIAIIAAAAGYKGMIEGQMRDIEAEGKLLSLEELEQLHRCKTGALIEAAVISGAIFAGADSKQIESLRNYAGHIGLAFQVADDILNVEGDPALLGKAVGTDESRKKSTYPALMGLVESKAFAKTLIEKAIESLNIFDVRAEPLRDIARYIIERKR